MLRILVIDDDPTLRMTVRTALTQHGHQVDEAEDGEIGVKTFRDRGPFDAVLLDVNMPKKDGIAALQEIKELDPATFCLVLTAYSNVKDAVAAMKQGAYDYVDKPVDTARILRLLDAAQEASQMVQVAAFSAPQVRFDADRTMIGDSNSIRRVYELIHKLSKVDTSVLIRGESGTGKELVARAIHFNSHRKKGPFVAVNCAAIPENLIESELFGHEKGAFTGAERKKIGKFQYAETGTLFLDEIGDISAQMQVKLLRVLQEKRFTPVGANGELPADVRIIAATNRPLEKMIEEDTFRPDLFYRLNVLPITLPPLRDRREDIEALTKFMIAKFNKAHGRQISGIDRKALGCMKVYGWPGNIRELENVIEHAFILESSATITAEALPEHVRLGGQKGEASPAASADEGMFAGVGDLKYPVLKERFEREFLMRALKAFNGRINQTAENTQMTKVTLLRKLEKYGIDPKQYQRL